MKVAYILCVEKMQPSAYAYSFEETKKRNLLVLAKNWMENVLTKSTF